MNYRGVLFLLGRLLLVLATALLVPAIVAYLRGGEEYVAFLISAGATGITGLIAQQLFRQPKEFRFGRREAFLLVSAAWVTASLVGAVPYILIKGPQFALDAFFESTSGFTTTGATVITDLSAESAGLLLWRSLTQWLGGMGIIVLGIAVLPKLAIGGMELLSAEAPGPIQEKLTPRIAQTAKALWGIYALLTLIEAALLILFGMTPFDAFNHAFTTMATSGFSTSDNSIGAFAPAIQIVSLLFMIVAGSNFSLHFHLLRGRPRPLLRDPEFRFYLGILFSAALLLTVDLLANAEYTDPLEALRLGAFQATTMVTTTGYATADFDAWPAFSRALLFLLMFVGGSTGSTGGSIKVVRIMIAIRSVGRSLKRFVQPNAVLPVRIGQRAIPDDVIASVNTFLLLFLVMFAAGGLMLSAMGLDVVTSFSASAACLGNVGPGFGLAGPAQTYAPFPAVAKMLLMVQMLFGRLELYTILVLFFFSHRGLGR